MDLVTIEQMKSADSHAINELGIPEEQLMSNAARALTNTIVSRFDVSKIKITIFCGPGNNGGDGWATAAQLYKKGAIVNVISTKLPKKDTTAGTFALKTINIGIPVSDNLENNRLDSTDVIIDALFGIGMKRPVEGKYLEFIEKINNANCYKVSADVPSGLYTDEGLPNPIAVKADLTVCFGRLKAMLFTEPGFSYAGTVTSDDIKIPEEAYSQTTHFTADFNFTKTVFSKRNETSFKGNYGKILVIAGSPGMTGAAALCCEACFRSGAGLVYNTVPKSRIFEYDKLVKEAICIPVEDGGFDYISDVSAEDIVKAAVGKTAIVIGPGLHQNCKSHEIFKAVVKNTECPIIIDAKALLDLAHTPKLLKLAKGRTIITPHPGEMAHLTGMTTREIQKSRIKSSAEFALKYNTTVLLKGHKTVITDGEKVFLNTTGNPGMATAGSGDVLCGIIAATTAYTTSLVKAASAGAFVHGLAGDIAAVELGEYSMKSGDIIKYLPNTMKKVTGES